MGIHDELKQVIDDFYCSDEQELDVAQLDSLRQQLDQKINYERYQQRLFTVTREDRRLNLRLQLKALKEALASEGIEVEEGTEASPRREDDVIRWDIYRRAATDDRATLKLTEDNVWSIGIAYPKKSDLYLTSLTRLLSVYNIDKESLGGWLVGC